MFSVYHQPPTYLVGRSLLVPPNLGAIDLPKEAFIYFIDKKEQRVKQERKCEKQEEKKSKQDDPKQEEQHEKTGVSECESE